MSKVAKGSRRAGAVSGARPQGLTLGQLMGRPRVWYTFDDLEDGLYAQHAWSSDVYEELYRLLTLKDGKWFLLGEIEGVWGWSPQLQGFDPTDDGRPLIRLLGSQAFATTVIYPTRHEEPRT